MNHLPQIAENLSKYDLDAMLITSGPGEYYAVGFHGEGFVLVTPQKNFYSTDSRYLEAAAAIEHAELCPVTGGADHLALAAGHIRSLGIKSLGFEEDAVSFALYNKIREALPPEKAFFSA